MTSVAVAAARSLEAQRSDSLVNDPWAAALVEASGITTPFPAEWPDAAVIERAPALEDTPESRRRLQEMAQATGMPMDELLARADPPDPAEVLSTAGWTTEDLTVAALEHRYGRTLSLDGTAAGESRGGFVIGSR